LYVRAEEEQTTVKQFDRNRPDRALAILIQETYRLSSGIRGLDPTSSLF
jgi:hypothetical protein